MPIVEFLAAHHDRSTFDCGKDQLNRSLRERARQNADRNLGLLAMAETEFASRKIGVYAIVLDAIDEVARSWYLNLNFGFKPVRDDDQRLYVQVKFIRNLNLPNLTHEL